MSTTNPAKDSTAADRLEQIARHEARVWEGSSYYGNAEQWLWPFSVAPHLHRTVISPKSNRNIVNKKIQNQLDRGECPCRRDSGA